jgi:hypothetical protein
MEIKRLCASIDVGARAMLPISQKKNTIGKTTEFYREV